MDNRPIVILDTSAINRLLDEPDSPSLVSRLMKDMHVRFSFTSLSEVISTTIGERRKTS